MQESHWRSLGLCNICVIACWRGGLWGKSTPKFQRLLLLKQQRVNPKYINSYTEVNRAKPVYTVIPQVFYSSVAEKGHIIQPMQGSERNCMTQHKYRVKSTKKDSKAKKCGIRPFLWFYALPLGLVIGYLIMWFCNIFAIILQKL